MNIHTNATDRKAMVKAISEHLGIEAAYMGPPSFSYQIGDLTVNRDSSVASDNEALAQDISAFLAEQGYIDVASEQLVVDVPVTEMDGVALKNLIYTVSSKQYLLNSVLGTEVFLVGTDLVEALQAEESTRASDFHSILARFPDSLVGLSFHDDNARFTFPVMADGEKNRALVELMALMVHAAKEAKRVCPTKQVVENEKYYFRIWLLRLGLTGQAGKESRRALLSGLKGHTAFRTPEEAERFKANQKAKREALKAATDPDFAPAEEVPGATDSESGSSTDEVDEAAIQPDAEHYPGVVDEP